MEGLTFLYRERPSFHIWPTSNSVQKRANFSAQSLMSSPLQKARRRTKAPPKLCAIVRTYISIQTRPCYRATFSCIRLRHAVSHGPQSQSATAITRRHADTLRAPLHHVPQHHVARSAKPAPALSEHRVHAQTLQSGSFLKAATSIKPQLLDQQHSQLSPRDQPIGP